MDVGAAMAPTLRYWLGGRPKWPLSRSRNSLLGCQGRVRAEAVARSRQDLLSDQRSAPCTGRYACNVCRIAAQCHESFAIKRVSWKPGAPRARTSTALGASQVASMHYERVSRADDRWGPVFTTLNLRWLINLKEREMRSERIVTKALPPWLQRLVEALGINDTSKR